VISLTTISFGEDNTAVIRKKKSLKHWSTWKKDTTIYGNGITIIKKRSRYLKNINGHEEEAILFKYDNCNNLIQKTKHYSLTTCFCGKTITKYDKHFKSNCTK
jgi:hypothetical protein